MNKIFCPGCIFGFWYNWGVMQNFDIETTYFMAISGSALAAVCSLCELDVKKQLDVCNSLRSMLFRLKLHSVLLTWLESELPVDCHLRCTGKLCILVRKLSTLEVTKFTSWRSKRHLIDTLIAACSPFIPYAVDDIYFIDCVRFACPEDYTHLPQSTCKMLPPTKEVAKMMYLEGQQVNVVPL